MRPAIQLWLPLFDRSIFDPEFARDLQRAQEGYRNDSVIYLDPDLKEAKRFQVREHFAKGYDFCWYGRSLPSETVNVLHVVHISEHRFLYSPIGDGLVSSWQGRIPNDLFQQWLNKDPEIFLGKREVELDFFPTFTEGGVSFEKRIIKGRPGPAMVPGGRKEAKRSVTHQWPPPGVDVPDVISPETEIEKAEGPLLWKEEPGSGLDNLTISASGKRGANYWYRWPDPLRGLFPVSAGLDTLTQRAAMKNCIERLEKDRSKASTEIQLMASKYFAQGETTLELSFVAPHAERDFDLLQFHVEGKFGIRCKTLGELLNHPDYPRNFRSPVPILRLFGWVGYFWWELNETLKIGRSVSFCGRCRKVIQGVKTKRFCGPKDDLDCYQGRRREDKARERRNW